MKDKIKILSIVSIFHAFDDGAVTVIPILFPVFKTIFNLSYTQVGIITGGGLLITLIAQIFIGRISDRKNRRTFLSIGILLLSGSILLITNARDFITLVLFIFLLRFSAGFFHPIGIGLISRTFKKDRLDWAMGIQSALGDLGAFIAILTTLLITEIQGWSYLLYLWSIAGIICLFTGLFLTRNISEKYLVTKNNNLKNQTFIGALFEDWEMIKKLKVLLPGFIMAGSAWGIIVSYLPLLLDERTTLSLTTIGFIVSIWLGMGTIVCIFYGKIQSFVGRKNLIIFAFFSMGIMGFCLSIFTNILILIVIIVILGVSTFLSYPALFSFVSEITDEKLEGRTFGYTFTLQLGGGTVLLFLGGVTSDLYGIWTPFTILGILCLIVAFFLIKNREQLTLTS